MKIFDVPKSSLERIAEELGIRFDGNDVSNSAGIRVEGRLLPPSEGSNPYQRTSASFFNEGRKVHAVCWHGHRDFMRKVFGLNPNARITTGRYGKTDYRGQEDFEASYAETGLTKIGAPIMGGYPYLCDACSCPESGEAN